MLNRNDITCSLLYGFVHNAKASTYSGSISFTNGLFVLGDTDFLILPGPGTGLPLRLRPSCFRLETEGLDAPIWCQLELQSVFLLLNKEWEGRKNDCPVRRRERI